MKKLLPTVVLLAAATLTGSQASAEEFVIDGLRFATLSDSTVTVKKYVSGTDIVIPASITITENEGEEESVTEYSVVSVSGQAFYNAQISSVTVPSTVTTIEQYAFWRSTLKKAELAEGVESIGFGTFKECQQLTEVSLPSTLKELGAVYSLFGMGGSAFNQCGSLVSIQIPASVREIPDMTFAECTSLSDIKLAEGLEKIGERAFEGCVNLTSISLPQSVETIERAAFNKSWIEHPVIKASTPVIPNSCFLWCYNMTGFTIEEGVVEVGRQSFADCGNITEIETPNSVEWIRTDAFQGNPAVTTIKLGSGLRRLGHSSLAVWAPDQATNTPHWSLKDIYIASPVPPYHEQNDEHYDLLEDDFFFGGKEFTDELKEQFFSEVTLHVPDEALEAYREDPIWGSFANIVGGYSAIGSVDSDSRGGITIENGIASSESNGIEVYNISGVRVRHTADNSISLRDLAPGIYIVRSGNSTAKAAIR